MFDQKKSHGEFDNGDPFEEPVVHKCSNLKPVDSSINTLGVRKILIWDGKTTHSMDLEKPF